MSAFRLAISLPDCAFSVSSSWFRHDSRSGTIPDVQSARALEDQAMQAMTKIAAPAFLTIAILLVFYSAVIPVAWIIRPHFSIDVFSKIEESARATTLGSYPNSRSLLSTSGLATTALTAALSL